MAKRDGADSQRRVRRRRDSSSSLDDEKLYKSGGKEAVTLKPDFEEVRKRRIDNLERRADASVGKMIAAEPLPKMASESHATVSNARHSTSGRRRHHHRSPDERRQHRRRDSIKEESTAGTYVYGAPADREKKDSGVIISETRLLGRDEDTSASSGSSTEEAPVRRGWTVKEKHREKKPKIVYVTEVDSIEPIKRKEHRVRESSHRIRSSEFLRRSSTHHSRRKSVAEVPSSPPPKRHISYRHLQPQERPTLLKRSNTTSGVPSTSTKTRQAPSLSPTKTRRSSIFGGFFGAAPPVHHESERLVECLTCLSDDIPRSKAAKLKCGHRMCHSCLRRIFKLSVVDPQHMPPKCCTADHIPLKHVDKLFNNDFKRTWNRKYHEFSTKGRIYCPARRCGEWIKPENIHKENGRKYGKCGRCKTKVCYLCNGKWHGMKDCPKDEETNRLLETAKQAGWQRCYSCRTMVELKEGCNHMTCRCTAEFCMICGLKWKTCNCPWFNYEAVEADRLNHMQVPVDLPLPAEPEERPRRLRRPRPNTYVEEIDERHRQERMDEEIARRLNRVNIADDASDYQGGIGNIHGVGNGAGHFMNDDYVRAAHNILTGNYDQAAAAANYVMGVANARGVPPPHPHLPPGRMTDRYPAPPRAHPARPPSPPPPVLRRHSYNIGGERVVPMRTRTDYETESAIHQPARSSSRRARQTAEPRTSILAGLGGRGNRVSAWRSHIEPGVEPEEGMLSI